MQDNKVVYPYIPNSVPEIKAELMREVGVTDDMELFEEIPEDLQLKGKLNLPPAIRDEYSIKKHTEDILKKNINCSDFLNFIGAGCARHFVPAVCDEINGRGEFATAYGAETWADHGKHQALFEYQSMMAELLDMDFLTVPTYDGANAAASSLLMAHRINGRKKVLLPRTMDPDNLTIIRNYLQSVHQENALEIVLIDYDLVSGLMNLDDLKQKINSNVAAVLIENPSYLGFLETKAEEIGRIVREAGAEFIVYTDPISLGVLEAPANYGATITCGDFRSLGLHLACGGGVGGFIATFDDMKYMQETKDLVDGLTETIVEGEYGFATTMIERTHYALREKGKEFTGTGTNLWAITVGVYLAIMGPKGMWEVGDTIMKNARYAAQKIAEIPGIEIKFSNPFFKEFVVNFDKCSKSTADINRDLLQLEIFGGKDLSGDFPELGQSALYCVTETHSKEEIDRLVEALREVSR
ncbi:MAG: aminomethyl-transferring glycine dehydrogenase subunit GcvPA [Syntrophomonadaceae bacterium]|nr:aminomethyl-transferring glycine dehydrogenase subunit GcvPA [Syntrophomonadaceae bacterium]MDD3889865.1 aminomethyl-transferring glycine dehydrogenase subunit GcvPA [Syntrophomonadaceae bacterium]MDD4549980.1 aminomethyl-transferring glycine dehydrogenase subunit GcvPA [Syntrophomonadaceae bacterium]